MKTTIGLIVCAMLAMAGLAAPVAAKTFVYCSEGSPEGFDPSLYASGTTLDAAAHTVYNRLLEFEPGTTNPVAGLAESYEIAPDGTVYTFRLRAGVKFQTTAFFTPSRALNADDVVFSLERQIEADHPWHRYVPGASWEYANGMGFSDLIKAVEKRDDLTVRITLNRPEASFLASIAMPFASILSKEYADRLAAEGRQAQLNQMPLGTGPFSFVGYQQDAVIRYAVNKDYWNGVPKIDNLVFAITTDAAVRYQKLKAGECHLMPYPNAADVAAMKADPRLKVMEQEGMNVAYLAYNTTQPPFDRPELRRALNKAINKAAIVGAVFQGMATPARNPIPPTMWSYDKTIEDDIYDPEAAKNMIEQAGVKDLSIKLWAMPVSRPYMLNARRAAEIIQEDFSRIGVKAEIVSYEWAEYLERSKAKDRDGAVILGWVGDNGDPDNFLDTLLGCDAVGGNNRAQWCNPEFDALVQKAKTTSDRAERSRLYRQAQAVFKREAPWAPLSHALSIVPMRKEVTGFIQSPLGDFSFDRVDLAQ